MAPPGAYFSQCYCSGRRQRVEKKVGKAAHGLAVDRFLVNYNHPYFKLPNLYGNASVTFKKTCLSGCILEFLESTSQ